MILSSLETILRKTGRTDLKEALEEAGTEMVFCATEEKFRSAIPADGRGLVVVTDDSFVLKRLKEMDVYDPQNIFSVGAEHIEAVDSILRAARPTVVVGFGGGRVLDVAKMAAFRADVPLISVPTAPTHDGLLSRNCSLIMDGKKVSFVTKYPSKIVIPEHMWRVSGDLEKAGRLDVLSNITALQDVSLAIREQAFTPANERMSMAADAVIRTLSDKSEDSLAEALFLSGLAMHESSRYCSGSEHELEKLLSPALGPRYFHGQLAGGGALLVSLVYKKNASKMPTGLFFDPSALYDELVSTYKEHGLLGYALAPFLENDHGKIAETLRGASGVRPKRYTLWDKIDSKSVPWRDVLKEVSMP